MSFLASSEVLAVGISVAVMAFAQAVLFYLYRERKDRRYDEDRRRAEIEMLRESLEKRIYDLTDRLVSKEERWRDINHLLIESKGVNREFSSAEHRVQTNKFLEASGLEKEDFEVQSDLVFVLTPFNEKFESEYEQIAKICSDVGLRCARGDEEHIRGDILSHILKNIVKARVVVANINGRNPNVFYELGIAHALDKPTLIVSRTIDDIPFDLRSRQLVVYSKDNEFSEQLSKALLRVTLKNA